MVKHSDEERLFTISLSDEKYRYGVPVTCDVAAATAASLSYSNIHALISISATDEIRDMPSLYSLPEDRALVSSTGNQVADNWADLLDGTIDSSLQTAGVLTSSSYWWSASTFAGALHSGGGLQRVPGSPAGLWPPDLGLAVAVPPTQTG